MFGNNAISSSWTNPQQNQQQQQQQPQQQSQPNAFGQPTGFGTASFGSGAFGQPQQQQQQQQQQQPQANPMFGNLGATPAANTNTPSTGFGAFGSTNTASNTGGLFGQPKPAGGFGAFGGGTSTFGGTGTGAFGTTNTAGSSGTGTGLFGAQPSTSTGGTFGGGGLFGASKPATGFGVPTGQTGADGATQAVTTGTANPQYQVFSEKDATSNTNATMHYQAITMMPQYRGSSFEELRLQDYQQGRKTAGAFGQTSFTAPAQPSTGLFGQTASANPAPASNTMFGAFGNTNTTTTPAPATGAFGTFGQPTNTTAQSTPGTSLFGGLGQQQPQQPQTAGFGAFGQPQQPQQQNTGTGLFGGTNTFGGNNQAKPAFSAFGGGTNTFGSTGTFGQPLNTQQQGSTAGGAFGQPQQPQQGTSAFGAFGTNNNAPKASIFGTTQPAQPATGFSAFGNPQQTQPGQTQPGTQPAGGLFGGNSLFNNNAQQQQPGQQQQQQPQQGTGLFGTQPTNTLGGGTFGSGGLFGNNTQNQQQQQQQQQQPGQQGTFSLFGGNKPQTTGGGLFGPGFGQPTQNTNAPQQQTSIFGTPIGQQSNNQQGTSAFGSGSLFAKPTAPALGTTQSTGQQGAGSLFNSTFGSSTNPMNTSALGQSSQATLTASIAQPIATNLPIFSMLPPGPRAVNLESPKKKPGYFVDVPTRSPVPRLGLSYAPANTKLRGFGSTTNGPGPNLTGSNLLFPSSKPNALSLSKASNGKSVLGPEAFLSGGASSPTLGSGGKSSVKKLVLDKKVEPSDFFHKSGVTQGSKATFNPALSVAAREKEMAAGSPPGPQAPDSPSPAPQGSRTLTRVTAQSSGDVLGRSSKDKNAPAVENGSTELQEGDYWMKPDLETLKKAGYEELVSLKGLVVGRKGYGQITFLDPVDLTNVPKLAGLLGELVRFDDQECSVYPDSDEAEKPLPGSGLNVRARIELVRCWALDRATREPIKDEKHPHAVRHLKRLKHMKQTHFESFDIAEGKWTFTVDHF